MSSIRGNRVTIKANQTRQLLVKINQATKRALNRAADSMRVEAQRRLAAETGLRQDAVKRRLRTDRATPGNLAVAVRVSGIPVQAIQLGARQGRRGTTVGPRHARTLIRHAFIARGRKGPAVFLRTTRKRWPLAAQLADSLAVVATREKILEAMRARGEQVFAERLKHELGRELGGGGR